MKRHILLELSYRTHYRKTMTVYEFNNLKNRYPIKF